MSINAIKDAIKALAQSLQIVTIFPATLFILLNAYAILPGFGVETKPDEATMTATVVACVLVLSYTLYAFNFPIIRLFEGYKLSKFALFRFSLKSQQDKFDALVRDITRLAKERELAKAGVENIAVGSRVLAEVDADLSLAERTLDTSFPPSPHSVLPTRLGNTILAFEEYPRTRYGMDSIALWPRLVPVLYENKYLDFVAQEKAVFDFMLNMFLVGLVLGIEFVALTSYRGQWEWVIVSLMSTLLLRWVIWNGMIVAARQWGTMVRVSFDLYRNHLHERLGLKSMVSFPEQCRQWTRVSAFLLHQPQPNDWLDELRSQEELAREIRKGSSVV